MEYNLNNDYIEVKTSTVIKLSEHFTLTTTEKTHDLKVDIVADLKDIPEEFHEVFVNMLTSKYLNKVSFGDNPFSECKPPIKRKWYQFWKILRF
jgi:hypothetical protein